MINRLLYVEFLTAQENFASVADYLGKYGFCHVSHHDSGKSCFRAPGCDSCFVIRSAISPQDIHRVSQSGTTVVDVCFLVDCMDVIVSRVKKMPESPTVTSVSGGVVVMSSPLEGLVHTLVESSSFNGSLKGWSPSNVFDVSQPKTTTTTSSSPLFSYVDHITLACYAGTTAQVGSFYERAFALASGAGPTTLESAGGGLRLSVLDRADHHAVKFTLVEPVTGVVSRHLQEESNQVTCFLHEHSGPGVQHVAFHTDDILSSVARLEKADVRFIAAPPEYYQHPGKIRQIVSAGFRVDQLEPLSILCDGNPERSNGYDAEGPSKPGYLLQVFTEAAFQRKTIFFELISRGADSNGVKVRGFGAGNIRDLFHSVAVSDKHNSSSGHNNTPHSHWRQVSLSGRVEDPLYQSMRETCVHIFQKPENVVFFNSTCAHVPVAVIGGGLCGLTAALALVRQGQDVVVIEKRGELTRGTRAMMWTRSTLQFWEHLGILEALQRVASKAQHAFMRVHVGQQQSQLVHVAPPSSHQQEKYPSLMNIPQYAVLAVLLNELAKSPRCSFMFRNKVVGLSDVSHADGMMVHVESSAQKLQYSFIADTVLDCCGADSMWRSHLVQNIRVKDQPYAVVADVRLHEGQGVFQEPLFWFRPSFHQDGDVFQLTPQSSGVVRMDFGVRCEAGPADETTIEKRVRRALETLHPPSADAFDVVWSSVTEFASGHLRKAVEARIVWLGDSLRRLSFFGARSGNEGIRDVASLCWRLVPHPSLQLNELLRGYEEERLYSCACDALVNSTMNKFLDPRPNMRFLRDVALNLCATDGTADRLLSVGAFPLAPVSLRRVSSLNIQGSSNGVWSNHGPCPGDYFRDGKLQSGYHLFDLLPRYSFALLVFGKLNPNVSVPSWIHVVNVAVPPNARNDLLHVASPDLVAMYDAHPGSCFLLRPDLYVCGRWRVWDDRCSEYCSLMGRSHETNASPTISETDFEAMMPTSEQTRFAVVYEAIEKIEEESDRKAFMERLIVGLSEGTVHVQKTWTLEQISEALIKSLLRFNGGIISFKSVVEKST